MKKNIFNTFVVFCGMMTMAVSVDARSSRSVRAPSRFPTIRTSAINDTVTRNRTVNDISALQSLDNNLNNTNAVLIDTRASDVNTGSSTTDATNGGVSGTVAATNSATAVGGVTTAGAVTGPNGAALGNIATTVNQTTDQSVTPTPTPHALALGGALVNTGDPTTAATSAVSAGTNYNVSNVAKSRNKTATSLVNRARAQSRVTANTVSDNKLDILTGGAGVATGADVTATYDGSITGADLTGAAVTGAKQILALNKLSSGNYGGLATVQTPVDISGSTAPTVPTSAS